MLGLLLLPVAVHTPALAESTTTVEGDDGRDAYVGTGGLILPASADATLRQSVAGCQGCAWRVTSPCVESALGNAFDEQPTCLSVTRGCPVGSLRRTWFRPEGEAWRDLGLMCMRERLTTVADVAQGVRSELMQRLPVLMPAHLPGRGIVTQIPVILSSGQPEGPQEFRWSLLGEDVQVRAVPQWRWRFSDGAVRTVMEPGRLVPSGGVSHVFRQPGRARVDCAAMWRGEFTVAGLGPFPVAEPIRQTASLEVLVGEGRALLTP